MRRGSMIDKRRRQFEDVAPIKPVEGLVNMAAFVAYHPYAVYTILGEFHSRYRTLKCAANTIVYGIRPGGWVTHEPTQQIVDYLECRELLNRAPRPVI